MTGPLVKSCTAFHGVKRIAAGGVAEVALKTKALLDRDKQAQVLIFDDFTGEVVELDFRGTSKQVLQRIAALAPPGAATSELIPPNAGTRGPGRPKLGVVAREVTLLPRHWDWLATQPGGASVALRKLVEHARIARSGQRSFAARARSGIPVSFGPGRKRTWA